MLPADGLTHFRQFDLPEACTSPTESALQGVLRHGADRGREGEGVVEGDGGVAPRAQRVEVDLGGLLAEG